MVITSVQRYSSDHWSALDGIRCEWMFLPTELVFVVSISFLGKVLDTRKAHLLYIISQPGTILSVTSNPTQKGNREGQPGMVAKHYPTLQSILLGLSTTLMNTPTVIH